MKLSELSPETIEKIKLDNVDDSMEKLIDLVWIGYHTHRQSSGANHHDIKRNLNWLSNLAERLVTSDVGNRDERLAKRKLVALGLGWYLEGENPHD